MRDEEFFRPWTSADVVPEQMKIAIKGEESKTNDQTMHSHASVDSGVGSDSDASTSKDKQLDREVTCKDPENCNEIPRKYFSPIVLISKPVHDTTLRQVHPTLREMKWTRFYSKDYKDWAHATSQDTVVHGTYVKSALFSLSSSSSETESCRVDQIEDHGPDSAIQGWQSVASASSGNHPQFCLGRSWCVFKPFVDVLRATAKFAQTEAAPEIEKKSRSKNHHCNYCNKSFSNAGQLKVHTRTHTGERPFKCEFVDCGKTFTRNEELTRHGRIHTGEKPHECSKCFKCFGRKDHLRKHLMTHGKEDS